MSPLPIQVQEFAHVVKVDEMSRLPDGVLVVWKWELVDCDAGTESGSESSYQSSREVISETSMEPDEDETEESNDDPVGTHTLTFKCVGTTKEDVYQKTLSHISNHQPIEAFEVKLVREPDNEYDARAISFVATVEGREQRIGYVVRDVLDEVHHALEEESITCVVFSWVKYLVQWRRSGIGYYCGINITKKGEWSANAVRCQSTLRKF